MLGYFLARFETSGGKFYANLATPMAESLQWCLAGLLRSS